ncbi:MAG TPA: hypothetical protein VGO13_03650 [Solirubrobacterales bacterium]|nr:hypothetical protein [Solirubrobacterales bacterium]
MIAPADRAQLRREGPTVGLIVALAGSAMLLLALGWQLTFFQDTWAFLMGRQPWSAASLLNPHNEHLVVFQVATEKALVEVFGTGTNHPEMVVMTATLLVSAALVFVWIGRRVDRWLALMAAVLLLFLGSAWQVLLWPFEIEFTAPIAAGMGMLLALEREDRHGDLLACLLLVVGIGFGSLGLSFAAAAIVEVFLKRRSRGWGRAYVFVVPLALYLGWYAGWGHDAEHHLTLHNILASPLYVAEGMAAAVGSLSGLSTAPIVGSGPPEWGRPLLLALVGLAIYRLWRRPAVSLSFWPVAAAALSYWVLGAFNFIPGREAASNRYQYAGGLFVLLIAAELLRGVRLRPRALMVAGAVVALAVFSNLAQMKDGYDWLKGQTVLTRADTGAIDIARGTVPPWFGLTPEIAGTPSLIDVNAADYLPMVREHGSPGYSPRELASAPEVGRRQADIVLSQALQIGAVVEAGATISDGRGCTRVEPGAAGEVPLAPGRTRIGVDPGPHASFSLRRFAEGEYPVVMAGAPGQSVTTLAIPRDRSTRSWILHVEAAQPVLVCGR